MRSLWQQVHGASCSSPPSGEDCSKSAFYAARVAGDEALQLHPGVDRATRWSAWLFMIGSACFALASVPALATVVPSDVVGLTYFVGSLFFTSAAGIVTVKVFDDDSAAAAGGPFRDINWWAAAIQSVGTLWFNVNTFYALSDAWSTQQENLRVWTPDMLGSLCFLVSSYLSWIALGPRPRLSRQRDSTWWIAALNLIGSVFFGLAAVAAFTLPSTDDLLDASIANSGTLLGALCFFWGARLMLRPPVASPTAGG
jgi:hypothetical protein